MTMRDLQSGYSCNVKWVPVPSQVIDLLACPDSRETDCSDVSVRLIYQFHDQDLVLQLSAGELVVRHSTQTKEWLTELNDRHNSGFGGEAVLSEHLQVINQHEPQLSRAQAVHGLTNMSPCVSPL